MAKTSTTRSARPPWGRKLAARRTELGLSLGAIEEATDGVVYIQLLYRLENGRMNPQNLKAPIGFILDNYGRRSQIPITMFGLKIGRSYPIAERQGEASFLDEIQELEGDKPGMMWAMLNSNRGLEGMDRFFRVRGDAHIYPLAVYVDLPLFPMDEHDSEDLSGHHAPN